MDPLILQVKEATTSVLAPYVDHTPRDNQGERVVAGQRLMQATERTATSASEAFATDYRWQVTFSAFDDVPLALPSPVI